MQAASPWHRPPSWSMRRACARATAFTAPPVGPTAASAPPPTRRANSGYPAGPRAFGQAVKVRNASTMGIWNNRQNVAKAPYRYRITGYTVGGPVYIPKVFNTKRDKLFFFWNQEYTGQRKDYGTRYSTMPTAAERGGDFSKSVTGSGTAIKIVDRSEEHTSELQSRQY